MITGDLETIMNEIYSAIGKYPVKASLNYYEEKIELEFDTALTDDEKNSVINICNDYGITNENVIITP